jgi:hypothetical protein
MATPSPVQDSLSVNISPGHDLTSSSGVLRSFPLYGWVGLFIMLLSGGAMLARIPPFFTWHTPIAWTGYLLFADAVVWKRRGASWLRNSPGEFFFLAVVSVPLWVVFEMYNKYSLGNWYYIGLPENLPRRYFAYAWSFATIWPAIFETADLVSSLRDRRALRTRNAAPPPVELGAGGWALVAAGAAMLLVPILYPSPYLAVPVVLGFILLLDPLNARAGAESLLGDWKQGRVTRVWNLAIAGLICGLLGEFWNFWSGSKWIYNLPFVSGVKLFEMPIAGFGAFPLFALECFVIYVAVRRWFWQSAPRPISL